MGIGDLLWLRRLGGNLSEYVGLLMKRREMWSCRIFEELINQVFLVRSCNEYAVPTVAVLNRSSQLKCELDVFRLVLAMVREAYEKMPGTEVYTVGQHSVCHADFAFRGPAICQGNF